jgi:hypothetical protein
MAVGFPTKANWAAGDVLTASAMDDLAGTVNTVQYLKPWNQLLNSNMSVWQRGTSFSLAASSGTSFAADRWNIGTTGVNQACTITRQATSDTTNLPNIQYAMRLQRNSGQTGVTAITFAQNIETVNSIPYAGKAVTVSYYARAGANYSAASNALAVYLATGTGTDQNIFSGFTGSSFSITGTATLTTTWQRFTFTGTVPASATQLAIYASYYPTGTAGTNDYFEVTGFQLEQGSVANTYQPNQATYETELLACQRYLPAFNGQGNSLLGFAKSSTSASIYFKLPVTARTNPTGLTVPSLSSFNLYNKSYAGGTPTAMTFDTCGTDAGYFAVTIAAGSPTIVFGDIVSIQSGNASGSILFTGCEL